MDRVGHVAVMKDHFVALERTPARQREKPAEVRRRHALEDAELHVRRLASLCLLDDGFASTAARHLSAG